MNDIAIVNPQQQLPNQQTEAFLPQSLLKPLQKGDEQQSVYAKDEASLFHGKHDKTMAGDAKQSGTSENCTDNCYYPRMMAPVRKQAIETKSPVRTEPTYANVDISLCVCCRHNAGSCCDSYHRSRTRQAAKCSLLTSKNTPTKKHCRSV